MNALPDRPHRHVPARRRHSSAGVLSCLLALLTTVLACALTLAAPASAAAVVPAESNGGTRVMPLGDSITEGTQVPGGYRIGLWQRMAAGRYTVDLVGSQYNGPGSLGDHDHEGHPGWRIDQIDANVTNWVRTYTPHTVLLHIGTNDVLQNYNLSGAPNRLSTLIDHITSAAPSAEVFVATITPLSSTSQEAAVRTFNAAVPGIVQSKVSSGKHVHLVDMHSALTTGDLTDGVHPTASGYDKMAATWYGALQSVSGSIGQAAGGSSGSGSLTPGSRISLRATTSCCTADYIRHDDNDSNVVLSAISSGSSATDKGDSTWIVRAGLANSSCLSFESANVSGQYLRHSNYQLRLNASDGSSTFTQDATFCPQAGHNGQGYSFQSVNFTNRYLRHYSYTVYIASNGGSNTFDSATSWSDDTSWVVASPWA